jgi:hypothetical protein
VPNTPIPPTTISFDSSGGTFTTDGGITSFRIQRYGILGQTNRINYVRNVWTINSRVQCDPGLSGQEAATNLDAKVVFLEGSVIRDTMDVIFSLGSTANLLSADCVSGTHVREFEWLRGDDDVRGSGAQGELRRTFQLVVYGDKIVTNTDTDITGWHESINAIGTGLARVVPVESLAGAVQPQQLSQYTPFWFTQFGFARGLLSYPTPPLPQFYGVAGVYFPPEKQSVEPDTPQNWGVNVNTQFGIKWRYTGWSAFGLAGNPNFF